jgi:hypothetical protein
MTRVSFHRLAELLPYANRASDFLRHATPLDFSYPVGAVQADPDHPSLRFKKPIQQSQFLPSRDKDETIWFWVDLIKECEQVMSTKGAISCAIRSSERNRKASGPASLVTAIVSS